MNKNYMKVILTVIILLLVLIMILIFVLSYNKNKKLNEQSNTSNEVTVEKIPTLSEEIIIPNNSYLFFGKYVDGEVDSKQIHEKIYKFANDILPKYYKDLKNSNVEEIAKYYSTNKEDIYKYMNIKNSDEFVEFIKLIQLLKTDELTLESMEFIEEGMNYSNTSTYSKFAIKYKDNEKITLNVKVYKLLQENDRNVVFYYQK